MAEAGLRTKDDDEGEAEDEYDCYYYGADAEDDYYNEEWWIGFSQCESDTISIFLDVH